MTDRELMQQALDAMLNFPNDISDEMFESIRVLRARLAQPEPEELSEVIPADEEQLKRIAKLIEPEPVGWFMEGTFEDGTPSFTQVCESDPEFYVPLYTAPPQREWQGLTDEEIKDAWSQLWYELGNGKFAASDDPSRHTTIMFAKEIEAKLKEKNA